MDTGKLSRLLVLGGGAVVVLAVVWFLASYTKVMHTMSDYGGGDMAAKMTACLYSSPAICQGADAMSDGPSYSPVIFWIGVIALLGGIVVRMATKKSGIQGAPAGAVPADGALPGAGADGDIMGFIAPQKYTRYVYILFFVGVGGGLLLPPLMIAGAIGLVLGLLGLFVFRPRLTALDVNHLAAGCVVFAVGGVIVALGRGALLFILVMLVELALYYIGFSAFRNGRTIGTGNLKEEAQLALKPAIDKVAGRGRD